MTHLHDSDIGKTAFSASHWTTALLLFAVTVLAYANSFNNAFVFDDVRSIVNQADAMSGPLVDLLAGDTRPAVTFSLWLNYQWGELSVWGYHLLNVLLHALCVLVLWRVLALVTFRCRYGSHGEGVAFATALLWAVHPLHTESVTYIIQRSEIMAALCILAVLWGMIRQDQSPAPIRWTVFCLVTAVVGMMSKPTVVAIIPLALLLDGVLLSKTWWPVQNHRVILHSGLFASAGVLWVTGAVEPLWNTTPNSEAGVGLSVVTATPLEYFRTQPEVLTAYLRLILWPANLCLDHDWPLQVSWLAALVPGLLLLGGVVGGVALMVARHWAALPVLGFFALMAPTSSVIPIRDVMVEHRTYLASAAVVLMLVAGSSWAIAAVARSRSGVVGTSITALVALTLLSLTRERNVDYRTPVSIWQDTVDHAPHNHRAWVNLGVAQCLAGQREAGLGSMRQALDLQSNDPVAQLNIGVALLDSGAPGSARPFLGQAAARLGDRPRVWLLFGDSSAALGDSDEARSAYEQAGRLSGDPEMQFVLGNRYFNLGDFSRAIEHYQSVASSTMDATLRASASFNLGNTYYRLEDWEQAIAAYESSLDSDPSHAGAAFWLAKAEEACAP